MTATRVLMDEHQTILRVLACLERLVSEDPPAAATPEAFRGVVDFLRNYADRLHHGKEEALLFPAMETRGLNADQGPTAAMRWEHDAGRDLVRRMADACTVDDDVFTVASIREPALEFVALLRAHIAKEDHILFPMADRMLDAATVQALGARYAEAEARDFENDVHDRYEAWALRLAHSLDIHDEHFHVTPACHG